MSTRTALAIALGLLLPALLRAQVKLQLLPGPEVVDVQTASANVVVLLIRDNDRVAAPSQQADDYRIDGAAPKQVGRHSATIYEERCASFSQQRYPQIVLHKIYLLLQEKLQDGRSYKIDYPGGRLDFLFDENKTLCESIKVNQVGYNPRARVRRAHFAQWMGDLGGKALEDGRSFAVRDKQSGEVVLSGSIPAARADEKDWAGSPVSVLDLSSLTRPGEYYIVIPGVGRSYEFGYGDAYAHHSFYVHLKGLYHERCGIALESPYTQWPRGACHTTMAITDAAPPDFIKESAGEARPYTGGHHDAGDFDKRPCHTLIAGWLMNAYEDFPQKFTDKQLDIPESGNGVPDLLDEALFSIRSWENLQEADGGVRAGVEAERHPTYGEVTAATDKLTYKTYRRHGHTTLAAAGLFAHASRLVKPFDPTRSAQLLERAQRAWAFYQKHTDDRAYSFSRGAKLYASCQLYLATGNKEYHDIFIEMARYFGGRESKWPEQYAGTYFNLPLVDQGMAFTHYFMSYLTDANPACPRDKDVVRLLTDAVIAKADAAERQMSSQTWGAFGAGGWGGSTGVGRWGDYLMNAYRLTGQQKYLDAASQAADFVLGDNPPGWCFTTGLGSRPPYSPLQLDSYPFMRQGKGPVPGIVVYGIAGYGAMPYTRAVTSNMYPVPDKERKVVPTMRDLTDGWSVVSQMEFTTWETMAPNAFLHACLAPETPLAGQKLSYGQPKLPGGYPK